MDLHIRPIRDGDVEPVVRLSLLAWAPVFASFRQIFGPAVYSLYYPDSEASQRAVVERTCRGTVTNTVRVAEVAGAVAGFVAFTLDQETRIGEVLLLAVHPDYQNHGVGTALNAHALAEMKAAGMNLAQLLTGADPGHAPARRSYEKAGYTALPIVLYYQELQDP